MRSFFLLVVLMGVGLAIMPASAVERIEEPLTFRHSINWKSNSAVLLGRLDMKKISAEDEASSGSGIPPRVAVVRKEASDRDFDRQGQWSVIDDMSVWRLKINSANAKWLSFALDNVFLPSGSSLFIYNDSRQQVFGPYTDRHNKPSGKLWTPMVAGDVAYIEINVPTRMKPYLTFDVKSVNHGYISLKALNTPKVGACNIDVVCPQGDGWRDEIRSVARYVFERDGGVLTCTGSMVNNTSGDRRPYFLTANHCVGTVAEVQSMVLFWNFEKSMCGGISDGSSMQTQSGATLLATLGSLDGPYPNRDMTLVELDSSPSDSFNVHWSGWDTDPVPPNSGVSIHHPDGDEKRISIDSGPIVITNFGSPQEDPNAAHLKIAAWDEGTTEGGSSGSGFWNSERRIVGVLSGGGASCDTPDLPDFYAHLASHYDIGTSSATRLKVWLDPANTGVTAVDGIDACDAPTVTITINPNPAEVNQPVTFTSVVSGNAGANYSYAWDFDGDGTSDSTLPSPTFTYTNTYIGNVNLTVNAQSCSASASAGMVVTPPGGNSAPIANAVAASNSADEESLVQLNGAGSSDPDGDSLSYFWTQTAGPVALLSSQSAVSPAVTLPTIAADIVVTFELTVTDVFGATDSDVANITVLNVNRAPVAIVSQSTFSINEGNLVTLNAGSSSDADGDNLTFAWTQTAGAVVALNSANSSAASFSAPQVTTSTALAFLVTVSDPFGLTDTATVNVTVNNVEPAPTGGGGGALGWPLITILLITAWVRYARRSLARALLVSGVLLLTACGTSDTNPVAPQSVESVSASVSEGAIVLVKYDARKSSAQITNAQHVAQMVTALANRERRYEKIKPIYEYEIQLEVDGEVEVWQVSPSGYIQKVDSYELYRMDMSMLKEYMK